MLDRVAEQIDELFQTAQEPTATFSEKAFIGRIADDIIELVGFAQWLGLGCLAAVLALVANAIVLGVQSRVSEHAVLQTLGYSSRLVAALIIVEGLMLSLIGGIVGAAVAIGVAQYGNFALATGFAICGVLGVLAGLVPAWQASRREIAECFRMA